MSSFCGLLSYYYQYKHLITLIITCCLLTMQRTESQVEFLHESHGALQTETFFFSSPPLKSKSLRLFTHSLFVLPPHSSPVLPSLFTPLSDSHDWLPVYVRRASSQSAVKAVILLVAIYYPVVCLKKDWKRAKLGACCWVSRHAKLSPQLTYIHLCPSAHESVCMCLCFF